MKDVTFITTTLNPSFAEISRAEIKRFFQESTHHLVYGDHRRWPSSWFDWLGILKNIQTPYYCFLDDDSFITLRCEIERAVNLMKDESAHLYGPCDAWVMWRAGNPVACNPFFMIGDTQFTNDSWNKFSSAKFEQRWFDELEYPFEKINADTGKLDDSNIVLFPDYEPFYCFFWSLKKNGGKFKYFYQEQDPVHKGTNLKISPESPILCKHLWYSRFWNSNIDVFGIKNVDRYRNFLKDEYRFAI